MVNFFVRKRLPILFIAGLALLFALLLGYVAGKASKLNQLHDELVNKGQLVRGQLQSELNHFANVAKIYSDNPVLIQYLRSAAKSSESSVVNKQLLEIEQAAQALDIYLLRPDGEVIAASNWQRKNSFIGSNFGFRHYVKQALLEGVGFELAVGVVSKKRGVYFSSVVKDKDRVLGVLVVKADVAKMEQNNYLFSSDHQFSFMVQDQQDVIFLSDQAQWRLKTLAISETPRSDLAAPTAPASARQQILVRPNLIWRHLGFAMWQLDNSESTQQLLVYQDNFSGYPWRIRILASDNESSSTGALIAATLGISYVALLALVLFVRERRINLTRLKQSHQKLSAQVALRTQDLTQANAQLLNEIEQRTTAENNLVATQEQLIQSAKLATIGQLSSSINHELNQPIAALSSYLQSTEKMLGKQMFDKVPANINRMHQLVERLVGIVSQFKNFSRKTNQPLAIVSIKTIVDNAIAIVGHHVQQHGVELKFKLPAHDIKVMADPIQLEQVVVNLLTNAVDALGDVDCPCISISLYCDDRANIVIKDNGLGIAPHYLNQIFEPFFTTKSNKGLGLGLSISRGIIDSFNGELLVENDLEGGAVFRIALPVT